MKCNNFFCLYQHSKAKNCGCKLMPEAMQVKKCKQRKAFNRFNDFHKTAFVGNMVLAKKLKQVKKELKIAN